MVVIISLSRSKSASSGPMKKSLGRRGSVSWEKCDQKNSARVRGSDRSILRGGNHATSLGPNWNSLVKDPGDIRPETAPKKILEQLRKEEKEEEIKGNAKIKGEQYPRYELS